MDKIFLVRDTVRHGGTISANVASGIREHMKGIAGKEVLITVTPSGSIAGGLDILPLERLLQDLAHLEKLSRTHIEYSDINAVLDLLNELSEWLPYAGRIQANTKYYWRAAESNLFEIMPESIKALSPSERTKWLRAKCAEHESLFDQAQRTVAAITHRCEHLRTFVSYEKALAAFSNAQNPK